MSESTSSGGDTTPAFSGVHHINLSVTDLERSVAWYREVLGLEMGWEVPDEDGQGRKFALLHPGSPLRIVLSYHRSNPGDPASEFRTGLDHVAFTVADRAELEAWVRRFEELKVDHSPIKEGATGYLITFRDPDNVQLEMYTRSKV
ncbi:MAG: VOC family protein [Chloroflexi bacterium]|nr:VOC family protein [Chloroflexota bacterium]